MKENTKKLKEIFKEYINLLDKFENIEKSELNDFYPCEENLKLEIIKQLNQLKKDYF